MALMIIFPTCLTIAIIAQIYPGGFRIFSALFPDFESLPHLNWWNQIFAPSDRHKLI